MPGDPRLIILRIDQGLIPANFFRFKTCRLRARRHRRSGALNAMSTPHQLEPRNNGREIRGRALWYVARLSLALNKREKKAFSLCNNGNSILFIYEFA